MQAHQHWTITTKQTNSKVKNRKLTDYYTTIGLAFGYWQRHEGSL